MADLLVKAKAELNGRDKNYDLPYTLAENSDYLAKFDDVLQMNGKKVSYSGYIEDDMEGLLDAVHQGYNDGIYYSLQ